jgi:division protein CdvB (Snf7/Vps24/ESCRT-III family)
MVQFKWRNSKISIVKRIEEKIRPMPLKERIANAIYRLNTQKERLDQIVMRLQYRDKELFQRCIGAQMSNDMARARIYANECAEIRKIVKTALSSQLALERVIIRLQTVHEFGDVILQMSPIMTVVKETKDKISGVVPEVAGELEKISALLSEIRLEAGEVDSKDLDIKVSNEEAEKVLQESSIIAEQKIRERFPEIPSFEIIPTTKEEQLTPIAEGEGPISLEDQVIEYIKECGGKISISKCAMELGISTNELKNIIEKLKEDGKILVETK